MMLHSIMAIVLVGLVTNSTNTPIPNETLTPSPMATPTDTPAQAGPTALPSLLPCNGAELEPNNAGWGCVLAQSATNLGTLDPAGDVDWYVVWMANDRQYRVQASAITPGLDPVLTLQRLNGEALVQSTRPAGSSVTSFAIQVDVSDYYAIAVTMQGIITGAYTISLLELAPTPIPATPTPGPTPTNAPTSTSRPTSTPRPGAQYEPNNDWFQAAELQLGQGQNKALEGGEWWAMLVKPGVQYQCAVSSAQLDPTVRVVLINGGAVVSEEAFNDDAQPGNPQAIARWVSQVDGLAYIEVASRFGSGTYQLTCTAVTGSSSGGGGGGGLSSAPVVASPTPTQLLVPTSAFVPSPTPAIAFRRVVAAATPTQATTTLRLLVYYDINDNKSPDPGEGIIGLPVRALTGNSVAGWGLTDSNGRLTLVATGDIDRVGVLYLNLTERVKTGESKEISWRIPPVQLPTFLPVSEDAETIP